MSQFYLLLLIPFLSFCKPRTSENTTTAPSSSEATQIVYLHIDQSMVQQPQRLQDMNLDHEHDIVIVARSTMQTAEVESSLSLTNSNQSPRTNSNQSPRTNSNQSPRVETHTSPSKPTIQPKKLYSKNFFKKDITKANPKKSPTLEVKRKLQAKDAEKSRDLKVQDIYENDTRKVNQYALVPEGIEVFRGMSISHKKADEILKFGIEAPVFFNLKTGEISPQTSVFDTIEKHQIGTALEGTTKQSLFVSTSYDKGVAFEFAEDDGVVFKISTPKNKGIDVNKARGKDSMHTDEREVAIIGHIAPKDILGYYTVIGDSPKKLGPFMCNAPCASFIETKVKGSGLSINTKIE